MIQGILVSIFIGQLNIPKVVYLLWSHLRRPNAASAPVGCEVLYHKFHYNWTRRNFAMYSHCVHNTPCHGARFGPVGCNFWRQECNQQFS